MIKRLLLLAALVLPWLTPTPAVAQSGVFLCIQVSGPVQNCSVVTATNPLPVTLVGGGGGGLSVQDQAAFTQGTSNFTPGGGVFNDAATLSSGQQGTFRLTTKRAQVIDCDSTNTLCSAISAGIGNFSATTPSQGIAIGFTSGGNLTSPSTTNPLPVTGTGSAGTAASGVLTVQGIASMTKLLVTPDSVALPANQSVNVSQVNGTTVLVNTGATGTGSARVTVATDQATNAGAALSKGGVGVVNGGSTYQTIAASQTGTVLQSSTGAIGDYLSHCIIYPTSTSPGVVTVFDNANAAATNVIAFPGGASSVSNLVPIAIPVGAVSTAGAWKATTGANVSIACFGKFS